MTRAELRREDGFVMATAIILLMVMASVGLAVVAFSDTQQHQAGVERVRESSFQLTEGAMQAQVFELGRAWPGADATKVGVVTCTPTSGWVNKCPDGPGLQSSYQGPDYGSPTCPTGTPSVPWTTSVHDNAGGAEQYYNRAIVEAQVTWDSNRDGKLWVRSQGVANCRVQTQVALVAQTLVPQPFPRNVVTANWFQTTNNGSKVIVNTRDTAQPQAAALSVRCSGTALPTPCAKYQATKGQVSPDTTKQESGTSPAMSNSQIESFRAQAQAAGTWSSGCPLASMVNRTPGTIYFAENTTAGNCPISGGFTDADPGFLVLARGTLSIGANSRFYGLIYAPNLTNLTGAVVSITGTAEVKGAITVDGPGGVSAGASKANLNYDSRVFRQVKGVNGAGIVQNSWRSLPNGQ